MNRRITVSIPEELVEAADQAVKAGKASSVSAYVAAAMKDYGKHGTLRELLREWEIEVGPPTTADYAWAREQLEHLGVQTEQREAG